MKIEIINKPMLCWNDSETDAKEYYVIAKIVTKHVNNYLHPYMVISRNNGENKIQGSRWFGRFKNVKPII